MGNAGIGGTTARRIGGGRDGDRGRAGVRHRFSDASRAGCRGCTEHFRRWAEEGDQARGKGRGRDRHVGRVERASGDAEGPSADARAFGRRDAVGVGRALFARGAIDAANDVVDGGIGGWRVRVAERIGRPDGVRRRDDSGLARRSIDRERALASRPVEDDGARRGALGDGDRGCVGEAREAARAPNGIGAACFHETDVVGTTASGIRKDRLVRRPDPLRADTSRGTGGDARGESAGARGRPREAERIASRFVGDFVFDHDGKRLEDVQVALALGAVCRVAVEIHGLRCGARSDGREKHDGRSQNGSGESNSTTVQHNATLRAPINASSFRLRIDSRLISRPKPS